MENKKEHELHFAVCRRCPKSYHRKCLPRKIAFEDIAEEGIVARAWEGLLSNNHILIYCLKHEIDDELGTPIRDQIKFPIVKEKIKPATKQVLNMNNAKLDDLPVKT
ncbi:Protein ENHANCED DOWNY MILDEW 2 [Trifolium repens]|nr:Protein ENHANCED DOWNY MILDEW 2 [Trifolium repens]